MENEIKYLYLDDIIPNRFQPREKFDEQALKELAVSISEHGVIQPIVVRQIGEKYEIIAGERRYKASTMAGLTQIPAIVRNLDDKESSKVALIENLQRKDLTPIEEARTYQKILELDSLTQEELARTMGKVQSSVSNKLRLLSLTDEAQDALINEKISERHARALLNITDPQKQIEMVNKIIEKRITVRELEEEIKKMNEGTSDSTDGSTNEQKTIEPAPAGQGLVEPVTAEQESVAVPTVALEQPAVPETVPSQDIMPNIMPDIMPSNVSPTEQSIPTTTEEPKVEEEKDEIINIETDENNVSPVVENEPTTENNSTTEQPVNTQEGTFNSDNLFSNLNMPPELPTPSNNSEFDVIGGSGMLAGMKPNETVMTQDNDPKPPEISNNLFGNFGIDSISSTTNNQVQEEPVANDVPAAPNVVPNVENTSNANDIPTIVSKFSDIVNNVKSSGKRVEMEEFDFDDFYQLVIRIDK